jgi:hypothetical protein
LPDIDPSTTAFTPQQHVKCAVHNPTPGPVIDFSFETKSIIRAAAKLAPIYLLRVLFLILSEDA